MIEDEDHWQPIERMPDGCNDVTIKYEDGSTTDMCSCDYWWLMIKPQQKLPIQFRFT